MFLSTAVTLPCAGGKFLELALLGWFVSKCAKKLHPAMRVRFPAVILVCCSISAPLSSGGRSVAEIVQPEHKINTFLSLIDCDFHFWLLLSIHWKIIHSWPPVNANNDREIIGALFVLTNGVSGIRTITVCWTAKFGEANASMCNRRLKALKQTRNYPPESEIS